MSETYNYAASLSRGFSYSNRNWPAAYPATQGQYNAASNRFYGFISFADILPTIRNSYANRYRLASVTMTVRRSAGSWGSARTLHLYGSKIDPSLPTGTLDAVFTANRVTGLYDVAIAGVSSAGAETTVTLPNALLQALIDNTAATGLQLECDNATDYMMLGSYDAATANLPYFTVVWNRLPTVTAGGDAAGNEGGSAAFAVTPSSGQPAAYSYQWIRSTDGGSTWANVSGATAATLTVSGLARGMNGYRYVCVVTNAAGSVYSSAMVLSVYWPPTLDPALPADASVTAGGTAALEIAVTADGNPADYSCQWYRDGEAIDGAAGSSCTVGTTAGEHTYYCIVTHTTGTVSSRTALLSASGSLRLKREGVWVAAAPRVRVQGVWKPATPYIRAQGEWRTGQ